MTGIKLTPRGYAVIGWVGAFTVSLLMWAALFAVGGLVAWLTGSPE